MVWLGLKVPPSAMSQLSTSYSASFNNFSVLPCVLFLKKNFVVGFQSMGGILIMPLSPFRRSISWEVKQFRQRRIVKKAAKFPRAIKLRLTEEISKTRFKGNLHKRLVEMSLNVSRLFHCWYFSPSFDGILPYKFENKTDFHGEGAKEMQKRF